MRRVSVFLVIVVLVFFMPAFSAAQMHGGSGQHMMGSGMGDNMGMMQQMSGPQGTHMQAQHNQQLRQMQRQLQEMKSQMK